MYVSDAVVMFSTRQIPKDQNSCNRSRVHLLFIAVGELQGHTAVQISQHEQRRGSTVCFRAQEGSVKALWQSSSWLTCLPPETTAIKPVVGCQSPVIVFFHKAQAWDLITEGKLDHRRLRETGWQSCITVQQGLHFDLARQGSICLNMFSDITTNSISKLIMGGSILTLPLLY